MLRYAWTILVFAALATTAFGVPSEVVTVRDGVLEVRDDAGTWGGMTNGITHMSAGDYTAKKILDTSRIPLAKWNAANSMRLSVYFMVRDYSWHDLPQPNGLDESYQIVVNGNIHEYPTNGGAPVFLENVTPQIGWYNFNIAKSELKHGPNEILIRKSPKCKGDDYLYLGIDNSRKRGNSYVAFDGNTWTQDMLTIPGGNGEYMVRLYVIEKSGRFEAVWQPGMKPKDSFFVYAGAKAANAKSDGLALAAGQSARVEWVAESVDMLEPVAAKIECAGNVELRWLDSKGSVYSDITAVSGDTIELPANRKVRPSGLQITAVDGPATIQRVIISGNRAFRLQRSKINMTPAMKQTKSPKALKPACKITKGEIYIASGHLRVKFTRGDRLKMVSLFNEITRTEMIRNPAACGLFIVEVSKKRYFGNRDFVLKSIKQQGNGFIAHLDAASAGLRGILSVNMGESGLRMGLKLINIGKKPADFKLAFPHLASLSVSQEIKDDYYFFPWGGGIIADTSATIRRGYGDHEALYQIMDIYSPKLGGGLYVRADDKDGWHKVLALRKHVPGMPDIDQEVLWMLVKPEYQWTPGSLAKVDGTAITYEYLRRTRKPGESYRPADAVLTAHAGDWHKAMSDYSKWAHKVWKFRQYPSKLKSVRNMMATGWATDYLFRDGKYRTDFLGPQTDCIELMSWWDWSPLGPYGTSFDQLDKVMTPEAIKTWEPYFVIDPVTGRKMWNNQPGDYDGYNPQFGGLPAFRDAVQTYKSMGALTTLYTDPFRMDFTSKIGLLHGKEWCVTNKDDKLSTEYDVYNPCHDLAEVREWVAKAMGRVMRETGADGIRLDEYGHRGWACYNPKHKHTFAEFGITQWQKAVAEATKMVHEEMDKVKPGLVLTTEHPGYDYLMQYLEGCITYDLTVQKSELRPLECNLQRFYFPECKAYELDHMGADLDSHKKFWNAVESFGRYYPENMYTILNENEEVYQGKDNYALLPTLQKNLYCNRFRGDGKTIYHLYNAMGHTFEGQVLNVGSSLSGYHVFELLSCKEIPVEHNVVSLYMERDDVACLAVLPKVISSERYGNRLRITLKSVKDNARLAVCDINGKELRGQKAKAGIQIVDLEGLTDPVCIKLLTDNQQLVDAVRITE